MRTNTFRHIAYVVTLLSSLAVAQPASAQPEDRRVFFTFNSPVELPGVALPPGRYMFRIADPDSAGRVVQVLSPDGKKVFGTFFAVPAARRDVPEVPEVRFMETASGAPPAVKTWWFPGEATGRELIYPRTQAVRLAKNAREPVLTTQSQSTTADQTNTAALSRVTSEGRDTAVNAGDGTQSGASNPLGAAQQGELAPVSIVIEAP
jgi:hypothetical protein